MIASLLLGALTYGEMKVVKVQSGATTLYIEQAPISRRANQSDSDFEWIWGFNFESKARNYLVTKIHGQRPNKIQYRSSAIANLSNAHDFKLTRTASKMLVLSFVCGSEGGRADVKLVFKDGFLIERAVTDHEIGSELSEHSKYRFPRN